jgi:hypothetical protein
MGIRCASGAVDYRGRTRANLEQPMPSRSPRAPTLYPSPPPRAARQHLRLHGRASMWRDGVPRRVHDYLLGAFAVRSHRLSRRAVVHHRVLRGLVMHHRLHGRGLLQWSALQRRVAMPARVRWQHRVRLRRVLRRLGHGEMCGRRARAQSRVPVTPRTDPRAAAPCPSWPW